MHQKNAPTLPLLASWIIADSITSSGLRSVSISVEKVAIAEIGHQFSGLL